MILWVGTYERAYPRTRVLVAGLRELGVEVLERHVPLWERDRHKAGAFLAPASLARASGRYAAAWSRLAPGALSGPGPVAVVAGYPAQPDAIPAWVVARRHGAPLVVDMMVSLVDTLAGDRGRAGRIGASVAAGIDRLALRAGDLALADTKANAEFLSARFGVPRGTVGVVPVGAEPGRFPRTPPPQGAPYALFYGKLSPLHGLETVLAAARRPGVPPVRVIGSGQLGPWLWGELARNRPPGLTHDDWVPYEDLGKEVSRAAICLGVFGTSAKAARVVPNKVWQALAASRAVITADTPGAREVLTDGRNALLVPAGDPDALAAALARLADDAALRGRLADGGYRRYLEVGSPRAVATAFRAALDGVVGRS